MGSARPLPIRLRQGRTSKLMSFSPINAINPAARTASEPAVPSAELTAALQALARVVGPEGMEAIANATGIAVPASVPPAEADRVTIQSPTSAASTGSTPAAPPVDPEQLARLISTLVKTGDTASLFKVSDDAQAWRLLFASDGEAQFPATPGNPSQQAPTANVIDITPQAPPSTQELASPANVTPAQLQTIVENSIAAFKLDAVFSILQGALPENDPASPLTLQNSTNAAPQQSTSSTLAQNLLPFVRSALTPLAPQNPPPGTATVDTSIPLAHPAANFQPGILGSLLQAALPLNGSLSQAALSGAQSTPAPSSSTPIIQTNTAPALSPQVAQFFDNIESLRPLLSPAGQESLDTLRSNLGLPAPSNSAFPEGSIPPGRTTSSNSPQSRPAASATTILHTDLEFGDPRSRDMALEFVRKLDAGAGNSGNDERRAVQVERDGENPRLVRVTVDPTASERPASPETKSQTSTPQHRASTIATFASQSNDPAAAQFAKTVTENAASERTILSALRDHGRAQVTDSNTQPRESRAEHFDVPWNANVAPQWRQQFERATRVMTSIFADVSLTPARAEDDASVPEPLRVPKMIEYQPVEVLKPAKDEPKPEIHVDQLGKGEDLPVLEAEAVSAS